MDTVSQIWQYLTDITWLGKVIISVIILLLAVLVSRILTRVVKHWTKNTLKRLGKRDKYAQTAAETKMLMIRRILKAGVYFFAFVLVFLQFDALRNIGTGLLASAGVAGLIIGLASQSTLSNIFAGISISFAQPVRLKDAVIFENEFGWIEDISLMHTMIRTWDNRRIVIPNDVLVKKVIQNWTIKDPTLLGVVMLYVDYTCDTEQLKDWVRDIVNDSPHATAERLAVVQVIDFSERTMHVRILSKGHDAPSTWDLRCEIRAKLIKRFREAGLPFPQIRIAPDSFAAARSVSGSDTPRDVESN